MEISLSTCLVRREHCYSSQVGQQEVLLDVDRGVYLGFDEIGSRIWRRLADPVTVRDIQAELVAAYAGPPEAIQADVLAFINNLAAQGLVETVKG